MNLVDSSAWLEYFADGPNAPHFAPVVQQTDRLIVPAVVIYEVFKVVLRESDENAAMQVCGAMQKGQVVDLDLKLALAAGKLSLGLSLPMADAMILATAREYGATIWTLDADFRKIPGVKYFPKK